MVDSLPVALQDEISRAVATPADAIVLCLADGSHSIVHMNDGAADALSAMSGRAAPSRSYTELSRDISLPSLLPVSVSADVAAGLTRIRQTGERIEAISPLRDFEGNITGYLLYVLSHVRGYLVCAFRSLPAGAGDSYPAQVTISPAALRSALRNGELALYAQPVLDVASGRTAGAEMLVRWRHPTRGLLGPESFLSAAEGNSFMDEFGAWVIDRCVLQTSLWERNGQPMDYFRVGINLSPRQLTHSDVVGEVRAALHRHHTSPDNILVEVVESPALESRSAAADQLKQLLELGVRVGIDDFGAGFANMAYLRDLPIDMIKVDRTLMGLDPTVRDERILAAVQTIAEAIGADVVLEGVERPAQFDVARRCHVRFAQGFLLGRPTLPELVPPKALMPVTPSADLPGRAAAT